MRWFKMIARCTEPFASSSIYTLQDRIAMATLGILEKIQGPRLHLLQEVCEYTGAPLDYALKMAQYGKEPLYESWYSKPRKCEKDYQKFYSESDFYIYRQAWIHRNRTWFFILKVLPKKGCLCEYGCGIAALSRWILERRSDVQITLADIPSSTWDFVHSWFGNSVKYAEIGLGRGGLPLRGKFDVITCFDVLEHTLNPLEITQHFREHLKQGGKLYINFPKVPPFGPNLKEAQAQRPATIAYLNKNFKPIIPLDGNAIAKYEG